MAAKVLLMVFCYIVLTFASVGNRKTKEHEKTSINDALPDSDGGIDECTEH